MFVYVYDRSGKDIFNIPAAKAKFAEKWKWKNRYSYRERSVVGKVFLFLLYTWKFMPPMVLLLLRKDNRKGHVVQEIATILASIAGATTYSALVALGIFSLPIAYSFIKHLFCSLFVS